MNNYSDLFGYENFANPQLRVQINGGEEYLGFAKKQLAIMKRIMKLSGVEIFRKKININDVVIMLQSIMGYDLISIAGKSYPILILYSCYPYSIVDNERYTLVNIFMFNISKKIEPEIGVNIIPIDTIAYSHIPLFDSFYTSSLIILNRVTTSTSDYVFFVSNDVDFNILWNPRSYTNDSRYKDGALSNYGLIRQPTSNDSYWIPPTGHNLSPYRRALLYSSSTPWCTGRRTQNRCYRYSVGTDKYEYSMNKIVLTDTAGTPPGYETPPGYTDGNGIKYNAIAVTNDNLIYVKMNTSYSQVSSGAVWYCSDEGGAYLYKMRWEGSGTQELYFGDYLIWSDTFTRKVIWSPVDGWYVSGSCQGYFNIPGRPESELFSEYTQHIPGDGSVVWFFLENDKGINVLDYDNVGEDKFICIYSINDISFTTDRKVYYHVSYKANKDADIVDILLLTGRLENNLVAPPTEPYEFIRMYGVSTQFNVKEKYIVYSYYIQKQDEEEVWKNYSFTINIIDISKKETTTTEIVQYALDKEIPPSNFIGIPVIGGKLEPGTYHYSVSAINCINQTLPTSPVDVATDDENKSVKLTWDAVIGATHYVIYGRSEPKMALKVTSLTNWTDDGTEGILHPNWTLPVLENLNDGLSAIGIYSSKNKTNIGG